MFQALTDSNGSNGSIKNNNDIILNTKKFIDANYKQKHSVVDLARRSNMSLYWFIRKYKDITGHTPIEYLMKIRIKNAGILLIESQLSIIEISKHVGYDNPFYFSRVFKKVTGYSPSFYRNEISVLQIHKRRELV